MNGGFGIRKSIDNNLDINGKLGWEIMTGPWIKLMNKYGCGSNPRQWANLRIYVYNTKEILTANTKWPKCWLR